VKELVGVRARARLFKPWAAVRLGKRREEDSGGDGRFAADRPRNSRKRKAAAEARLLDSFRNWEVFAVAKRPRTKSSRKEQHGTGTPGNATAMMKSRAKSAGKNLGRDRSRTARPWAFGHDPKVTQLLQACYFKTCGAQEKEEIRIARWPAAKTLVDAGKLRGRHQVLTGDGHAKFLSFRPPRVKKVNCGQLTGVERRQAAGSTVGHDVTEIEGRNSTPSITGGTPGSETARKDPETGCS